MRTYYKISISILFFLLASAIFISCSGEKGSSMQESTPDEDLFDEWNKSSLASIKNAVTDTLIYKQFLQSSESSITGRKLFLKALGLNFAELLKNESYVYEHYVGGDVNHIYFIVQLAGQKDTRVFSLIDWKGKVFNVPNVEEAKYLISYYDSLALQKKCNGTYFCKSKFVNGKLQNTVLTNCLDGKDMEIWKKIIDYK
ncbi:MAG: hypothetical protein ABIP51_03390 [Bacteroidia bacterium]